MRYHLFQKFLEKVVKIKETSFRLSKCWIHFAQHCIFFAEGASISCDFDHCFKHITHLTWNHIDFLWITFCIQNWDTFTWLQFSWWILFSISFPFHTTKEDTNLFNRFLDFRCTNYIVDIIAIRVSALVFALSAISS